VGSYNYYCNVVDSEEWNKNTNTVTLIVSENPTPSPSPEFNLPLEYVAGGIATIVGVAVLIFLLKRR